MGFFSRAAPEPAEPSILTRVSINGNPLSLVEDNRSVSRVGRLAIEAIRRIKGDPLALPFAAGHPLGDGHGMEQLVARIWPLFQHEKSLARWSAYRGSFLLLNLLCFDDELRKCSWEHLMEVMGLRSAVNPSTGENEVALGPTPQSIPPQVVEKIIGHGSIMAACMPEQPRFKYMSLMDLRDDPFLGVIMTPLVALDVIAWTATAILRLEQEGQWIHTAPEPAAMAGPGWYKDPAGSYPNGVDGERFWDASDWTPRCRSRPDGRRWLAATIPL